MNKISASLICGINKTHAFWNLFVENRFIKLFFHKILQKNFRLD